MMAAVKTSNLKREIVENEISCRILVETYQHHLTLHFAAQSNDLNLDEDNWDLSDRNLVYE